MEAIFPPETPRDHVQSPLSHAMYSFPIHLALSTKTGALMICVTCAFGAFQTGRSQAKQLSVIWSPDHGQQQQQ